MGAQLFDGLERGAFERFSGDTRALSVPLLTTVGSPPGIQAIRDQLLPLSFPAHVRTWYNAHDPRDVVALYPLNNDNFPVSLAMDNYQGVRNQTPHRHGLRTPSCDCAWPLGASSDLRNRKRSYDSSYASLLHSSRPDRVNKIVPTLTAHISLTLRFEGRLAWSGRFIAKPGQKKLANHWMCSRSI